MTVFDRTVYRLIGRIPPGRVATYGQIATLLGAPRAARAVGFALKRLPAGSPVPWHRVINARGGISLRANLAGMLSQRILLKREGVRFARDRVSLERYRWPGPHRRPVVRLPALERL
ncbi:MAG: methylated-DNA--[protein]-cysteine S-methyltransferase [Candidatus Rokubacteria bacterium]|nr:methylated-DNA--[protein]-cysteine S-methyltransferase [Candidatus Rokubacteria bacterium]